MYAHWRGVGGNLLNAQFNCCCARREEKSFIFLPRGDISREIWFGSFSLFQLLLLSIRFLVLCLLFSNARANTRPATKVNSGSLPFHSISFRFIPFHSISFRFIRSLFQWNNWNSKGCCRCLICLFDWCLPVETALTAAAAAAAEGIKLDFFHSCDEMKRFDRQIGLTVVVNRLLLSSTPCRCPHSTHR